MVAKNNQHNIQNCAYRSLYNRVPTDSNELSYLYDSINNGINNDQIILITPQNLFLTAQSTQIKSVISVPIKDFIHHYPRALFNDIPRVGAHFYDIPGSGRTFTTYPGRGAV